MLDDYHYNTILQHFCSPLPINFHGCCGNCLNKRFTFIPKLQHDLKICTEFPCICRPCQPRDILVISCHIASWLEVCSQQKIEVKGAIWHFFSMTWKQLWNSKSTNLTSKNVLVTTSDPKTPCRNLYLHHAICEILSSPKNSKSPWCTVTITWHKFGEFRHNFQFRPTQTDAFYLYSNSMRNSVSLEIISKFAKLKQKIDEFENNLQFRQSPISPNSIGSLASLGIISKFAKLKQKIDEFENNLQFRQFPISPNSIGSLASLGIISNFSKLNQWPHCAFFANLEIRLASLEIISNLIFATSVSSHFFLQKCDETLFFSIKNAMKRLLQKQGWRKVGERLAKGWRKVGERLAKGWQKIDERLAKGWRKVGERLAKGWRKVGERLAKGWRKVGERLAKGWRKVGERLAKGWRKVGGRLAKGWRKVGYDLQTRQPYLQTCKRNCWSNEFGEMGDYPQTRQTSDWVWQNWRLAKLEIVSKLSNFCLANWKPSPIPPNFSVSLGK